MVTRNTIKANIERMYDKEKLMLKNLLVSIPSRICLTSDCGHQLILRDL